MTAAAANRLGPFDPARLSPGVTFNSELHLYAMGGRPALGVTETMQAAGLVDFGMVNREVLEHASSRGTLVHLAVELDDRGRLNDRTLDAQLQPYVRAYRTFKAETEFTPEASELTISHQRYGYVGKPDLIGVMGHRAVIDVKTVSSLGDHIGIQLAAYAEAFNYANRDQPRERIRERYALQLLPNGGYRLRKYGEPDDLAAFLGALAVAKWKRNR